MLESRSESDLNQRPVPDADLSTAGSSESESEDRPDKSTEAAQTGQVAAEDSAGSTDSDSQPSGTDREEPLSVPSDTFATDAVSDEREAHKPTADRLPPQMDLVNVRGGLRAVVEAVLTASETPMDEQEIATSLGVSASQVLDAIVDLGSDLATGDRGVEVFRVGSRWQIGPRGDLVDVAARVVRGECATSLSRAAVETLAVIAYRQPITRRELADIRGLDVTRAVRSLVARGLIAESSIKPGTEETQLSTTADFLEYVQLDSLEDLPPI